MSRSNDVMQTDVRQRKVTPVPTLSGFMDEIVGKKTVSGAVVERAKDGSLVLGAYRLTPKGLIIERHASFAEHMEIAQYLINIRRAWSWMLADWLDQSEKVYGQSYKELSQMFGKTEKTLQNMACIAGAVEISHRWEDSTLKHAEYVMGLSGEWQAYWLRIAHEKGWSASQMKRVMDEHPDGLPDGDIELPKPVRMSYVERDQPRYQRRAESVPKREREAYAEMLEATARYIRSLE